MNCGREDHIHTNCPAARGHKRKDAPVTAPDNLRNRLVSEDLDSTYKRRALINGVPVKVYIDTGCQHNLIASSCAERLGLSVRHKTVILTGFGGGSGEAHGACQFNLNIDNISMNTAALVTHCDLAEADFVLGQTAIGRSGVSLIIRDGKARFVKDDQLEGVLRSITLADDDDRRCRVILGEDIDIPPGRTSSVSVMLESANLGEEVFMSSKMVMDSQTTVAIPSGILYAVGDVRVDLTNLGNGHLRWRKGRVIARAHRCLAAAESVVSEGSSVNVSTITILDKVNLITGELCDADAIKLNNLLRRKAHCFSQGETDLGLTQLGEMEIKLTRDVPVYYRPYRLSHAERRIVRDKVQVLVDSGVVRESHSDFASPIVLIRKKDGGVRLCVDYRALNSITAKDRYPLPLIPDQLDRLSGKRYFTTLDMAQGYHQVPMHPDSIHKTAFITPDGQYEYLRVPFGLANAPAVFQRIVNKMLGVMRHDRILAYMDDLLIPSETVEDGLLLLEQVLDLIEQAGFKLNLTKCSFLKSSIEYLGHEVSSDGIRPGARKVKAVAEFPIPTDVHGVRQFVGLASYFRKFIKNFAVLARPLTQLTAKDVEWKWSTAEQDAFDELKHALIRRPILGLYCSTAHTELHTDASKMGLGGILLQKHTDGDLRAISYFSRTTTKAESNYHSYELETLAVVESIRRFRVYLLGVHFIVVTDCSAVRATLLKRDLIPRIARWWLTIQEYDMEVVYRPGDKMQHVDALSRNPVHVNVVSMTEADWFLTVQLQDDKAQAIVQALSQGAADKDIRANFKVKEGRLWRKTADGDRLYVPAIAKFNLLRRHHDDVGHPGFERCFELIKRQFWFSGMRRFVRKYTAACMHCAFAKGDYGKGEGYLHPIEKRAVPFDTVHVDHLGPFVKSVRRNSYILVLVDAFTKFVIAKPTRTLSSAEAIEQLRWTFGEFGYPRRIISDQGLAFSSRAFAGFVAEKGIRHVQNAIATPRANGQVERFNRTIVEALVTDAGGAGEARWDERLPEIVWGMNHTINASSRFSPADLLFSHQGGAIADLSGDSQVTHGDQTARLQVSRRRAGENLEKTSRRMKARYDKRRKVATEYKVGDLVLWKQAASSSCEKGINRKVANKYDGPYKITKVFGNDRYVIASIPGVRGYKRFTAVVAADALRRYQSGACHAGDDSGDESTDSEVDRSGRQDLIDLLDG